MDRTEKVELGVICLIYENNKILLQDRIKEDWKGFTFPGGHVEKDESFIDAVIREMKEETGLTIYHPILCGVKQFPIDNGRYVVFLFKTDKYEGELISSAEGKMEWIERKKLSKVNLVNDFQELIQVFDDDILTEFQYVNDGENWHAELR